MRLENFGAVWATSMLSSSWTQHAANPRGVIEGFPSSGRLRRFTSRPNIGCGCIKAAYAACSICSMEFTFFSVSQCFPCDNHLHLMILTVKTSPPQPLDEVASSAAASRFEARGGAKPPIPWNPKHPARSEHDWVKRYPSEYQQ